MSNREQNIKAMVGSSKPATFVDSAMREHVVDAGRVIAEQHYKALLASLTPLQIAILEGDERYAVVEVGTVPPWMKPLPVPAPGSFAAERKGQIWPPGFYVQEQSNETN